MYTPTRFYLGQPGTTEETLYTVPAGKKVIVKQIILTNITGAAAEVSLSIVPSGGTVGDENRILKEKEIAANDAVIFNLSLVLYGGDFISAIQTTSEAVNVFISGVLID